LASIRYNGSPQIYLQRNGDGTLSVIRYDGGANTVLATSFRTLADTGWFYVEFYGKIDPTVGVYEARVDGTRWLSATGVNTSSTGDSVANQVRVTNNSVLSDGAAAIVDDFYISDDDAEGGSASIVGFAGPVKIAYQQITADGASSEWTPLSGSNYQNVDDGPASGKDDDASYVATLTDGAVDLYTRGSFEEIGVTIKAVAVHSWAEKQDALSRRLAPTAYVGGVEYPGDYTDLSTSYAMVFHAFERNPATGAEWTRAAVNAAQFGVTHVSP
jgi:hypothetical protein